MSPALVPKPEDWKNNIGELVSKNRRSWLTLLPLSDVVGFYFLDLATNYKPPPDLVAFLNAGEPPVYIGYVFCGHAGNLIQAFGSFGSVVIDDPQAMTSANNYFFRKAQV